MSGFTHLSIWACRCLAFVLLLGGCARTPSRYDRPPPSARIVERGVIACFEEGLRTPAGEPVYCETSAVAYDGTGVILAGDKPIPGDARSAVFSLAWNGDGFASALPRYFTTPAFVNAVKFEDFTLTPDGRYVIATTAFDRVKPGSAEWNVYNIVLCWPVGRPEAVTIAAASTTDGVTSSVALREKITRALQTGRHPEGAPYVKVEGLAAIPGGRLLFGIREIGTRYDDFDYTITLVAVSYAIEDGTLRLADDFARVYAYDASGRLPETVALSGLEYDRYDDSIYLLTSYESGETDDGVGGYLWKLPVADLGTMAAPRLVLKNATTPLRFAHKAEGVTVLGAGFVLVVHDDDRILGRAVVDDPETQFFRKAHQAAYTVVAFSDKHREAP